MKFLIAFLQLPPIPRLKYCLGTRGQGCRSRPFMTGSRSCKSEFKKPDPDSGFKKPTHLESIQICKNLPENMKSKYILSIFLLFYTT